ncbi:MAG: hypothetical protein R3208_13805 [Ketobacteraceae bacterium]|nr:hypothetical protein [Ketobacteraceae bacterium]
MGSRAEILMRFICVASGAAAILRDEVIKPKYFWFGAAFFSKDMHRYIMRVKAHSKPKPPEKV